MNTEEELEKAKRRIAKLERDLKNEQCLVELLIVGEFVKREKVFSARQLLQGLT